jgi:hypothetical protein
MGLPKKDNLILGYTMKYLSQDYSTYDYRFRGEDD